MFISKVVTDIKCRQQKAMDRRLDKQMEGQIDRRMDRQTDS